MFDLLGTSQLIARSGYSKQGGFEVYLAGGDMGSDLWDLIWDAGQPYNIKPGCPNLIERIEGGLMSYGNEFTLANNPLECGFDRLCHLGDEINYIGRAALRQIAADGPVQAIRGNPLWTVIRAPPCGKPFPVTDLHGVPVGQITSGIYSPRLETAILECQ
jgi:dimethylsulfoniopropionate demethylase